MGTRPRLLLLAAIAAGCTSFSGKDEGPATGDGTPAPGGADASSTPPSADGGPPANEAGVPTKPSLRCGSNDCAPGVTCCIQPNAETCGDDNCTGGWRFRCFGADDCGAGEVCCNRDKVVSCELASACTGSSAQIICRAPEDCPVGECQIDACGSNAEYGVCATAAIRPLCF